MADEMAMMGAHIDAFEYCPDRPEGTIERYRRVIDRRKAAAGMITDLLSRFRVNADDSTLISDKASDLEAARVAGLKGYFFSRRQFGGFCKAAFAAKVQLRAKTGIKLGLFDLWRDTPCTKFTRMAKCRPGYTIAVQQLAS